MRFDVTYEDGTSTTVAPGPADVLAFERDRNTTLGKAIGTGSPEWTYFLAWHKLSRRGDGRTFEGWLDDVETILSADEPDPTSDAPVSGVNASTDS